MKLSSLNITYFSSTFTEHFGDPELTLPKTLTLKTKVLEQYMTDEEILAEFKPQESTLEDLAYAIKNDSLSKEEINILYIRDTKGTLWAVSAGWDAVCGRWDVGAGSVDDPCRWRAGRRVFSRDFGTLEPPKTLDPLDTLTVSEPLKRGDQVKVVDGKIVKVRVCETCKRPL